MISLFQTACEPWEVTAAAKVLRSGNLVMGEHVTALERELSAYIGAEAVTCGSGTDALTLALEGLLPDGGEVIVPSLTFSASYEAVLRARCQPVVADVDARRFTLTVESIEDRCTPETRAVILVHLYGWPAADTLDIRKFCRERGLVLIEDAAQAIGAEIDGHKVGSIGDAAAFSFYPTKPLGGIGDGGAVTFREPEMAARARSRRNHGRTASGQMSPGYNSRLDEANAAVLRMRLKAYDGVLRDLRRLAAKYREILGGRWQAPTGEPAPYVYPILTDNRQGLMEKLRLAGIETRAHYDPPVCGLPYVTADCPNAASIASRVLSLPCHRRMCTQDVERVCAAL